MIFSTRTPVCVLVVSGDIMMLSGSTEDGVVCRGKFYYSEIHCVVLVVKDDTITTSFAPKRNHLLVCCS